MCHARRLAGCVRTLHGLQLHNLPTLSFRAVRRSSRSCARDRCSATRRCCWVEWSSACCSAFFDAFWRAWFRSNSATLLRACARRFALALTCVGIFARGQTDRCVQTKGCTRPQAPSIDAPIKLRGFQSQTRRKRVFGFACARRCTKCRHADATFIHVAIPTHQPINQPTHLLLHVKGRTRHQGDFTFVRFLFALSVSTAATSNSRGRNGDALRKRLSRRLGRVGKFFYLLSEFTVLRSR